MAERARRHNRQFPNWLPSPQATRPSRHRGLGRMPRSTYLGLFIAGLAAVLVGRASAACDVEVYVAIDASSAAAEASAFEIYAAFVQEAIDVANSFCTEIGETGRSARLGVTALRCDEDATLGVELLKPTPKARNIQKTLESFPDIYPGTGVCGELALAEVESYATKKANLNRRQRLLVLSDTPFYDEDSQEMKARRDALEKAGVQVINVLFSSNSTGLMQVATTMTRLYMTSIDDLEPSDLGLYLPTQSPTLTPTLYPTMSPTPNITASPTLAPSSSPTLSPSGSPTLSPTLSPTQVPTALPTVQPTLNPTRAPSASPTAQTSLSLTPAPTPGPLMTNSSDRETLEPTMSPSKGPATFPTVAPSTFFNETTENTSTSRPSFSPTQSPTTKAPTQAPTRPATPAPSTSPTRAPTQPTSRPTDAPTDAPSRAPTLMPTRHPSASPTMFPTQTPTENPTRQPTMAPTKYPSKSPTSAPTEPPVSLPTLAPTLGSTPAPSQSPTTRPTQTPLQSDPTKTPSPAPTFVATEGVDSTRSPTKAPTESVVEQPSSSPTGQSATLSTRMPTATPTLMPSAAVNETDGSVPDGSYSDELGVCPEGSYDTDGECFFVWDRNGNGRVLVYIICASVFLPVLLALGSLGWVGLDISLDVVASTGDLMTDIFYLTQEPYFNALLFGLSCTSVALTVLPYMLWLKRNPVRLHFGNAMLIRTERTLLLLIGSIVWWTVGFFLYAMKVLPFGRVKRTFLLDPDSGFLCGVARAWLQRINARIRGRPDSPAPRVRIEDPPFDPAAFNRMRLLEVAVESVPQFSVQLANGLLLNSWSVASALSLGFSGFLILRVVQQLLVYVALVGRSPDELPVGLGLFVEPVSTATIAIAQTQKRRQHWRRKTNKAVNPRQGHSPEEASQDQGNPASEAVDEASSPAAQAVTPQPPNTPKSTSGTEMTQV